MPSLHRCKCTAMGCAVQLLRGGLQWQQLQRRRPRKLMQWPRAAAVADAAAAAAADSAAATEADAAAATAAGLSTFFCRCPTVAPGGDGANVLRDFAKVCEGREGRRRTLHTTFASRLLWRFSSGCGGSGSSSNSSGGGKLQAEAAAAGGSRSGCCCSNSSGDGFGSCHCSRRSSRFCNPRSGVCLPRTGALFPPPDLGRESRRGLPAS